ncbi:SDR family NAD(P)-dependent oxidoreductase [Marinimicrococcus flavescens]|uniref:SDR family NAD(P)-dependent oxidoreductase n=1 Tax=Marinimicrococcus flavescens TaxID=3031815 RepID=A0AAP3UZF9_9PROT|nr:SDR family NAD(P)-dependent oxidoreductase [Marinimicrococcus flavescens]
MTRRVWITGASQGIGAALVRRMRERGDQVIGSARTADRLEELADATGMIPWQLDVTDQEAAGASVAGIEEEIGPIDLAILNAGTHRPVGAEDFRTDELRALVELNLFGTAHCLEALIPRMTARKAGHIAVVGSLAAYRGLPTAAYYGASKAALTNMTEALKFDLDRHGVRLQLVQPGFVRTPLTDRNEFAMPFLVEPEEAAAAIMRGLHRSSFEIAFPRTFVAIMKLMRVMPYRLYFPLVARSTRA